MDSGRIIASIVFSLAAGILFIIMPAFSASTETLYDNAVILLILLVMVRFDMKLIEKGYSDAAKKDDRTYIYSIAFLFSFFAFSAGAYHVIANLFKNSFASLYVVTVTVFSFPSIYFCLYSKKSDLFDEVFYQVNIILYAVRIVFVVAKVFSKDGFFTSNAIVESTVTALAIEKLLQYISKERERKTKNKNI